jgi:DNA-binding NtrC family response regulator
MQSQPPRVLYVEDDSGLANLFKRHLQRLGFNVHLAESGEEGLEILRRNSFDCLCVDHQLPGCTGLDVIKELASMDLLPPTIMISGVGDGNVAKQAILNGALHYIPKDPLGEYLNSLPTVINSAIEQAGK